MKKLLFPLLLVLFPFLVVAQGVSLKVGDQFPNIPIANIQNGKSKSLNLNEINDNKFYILNFWGTWCSPCIPEMDNLAVLQKNNNSKIQVIAISNEEPLRLINYLKTKPTPVLLASDTTFLLYEMFGFSFVGQSAILNKNKEIIALVRTDSLNQTILNQLFKDGKIASNAGINEAEIKSDDPFGVDTTMRTNFTVRSYMIGKQAMGKEYNNHSVFRGRRKSFMNIGLSTIYKAAYNIVSEKQLIYEVDKKKYDNYEDRSTLYCVDILVDSADRANLSTIFQQKLNEILPVKARIEYKTVPVYVLKNVGFNNPESNKESSYGFSGQGYNGVAVTLAEFADSYLSNEFELPVVDETALKGKYDIKTNMDMRTKEALIKSIEAVGLKVEKTERKIKMLVLF